MKTVLPVFVFVDACGWEIIRNDPFLENMAPNRKRLTSVFGYSSTCIPSILSGRWPFEHRNWSFFVYDPEHSPFRGLKWLRWLPSFITKRRRFRRWLSKFVKARLNFRGYFDLYNIPFQHISLFDFSEKKSPLKPGGLNHGPNLCDFLLEKEINHFFARPEDSEKQNFDRLLGEIENESIDFAFLYWPDLDGLLHRVGNQSPEISGKLRGYEEWLSHLMEVAGRHYKETRLYVFSDHGMANCDTLLDLRAHIDRLNLRMGEDYVVIYDSTMARFWFKNDRARKLVVDCLEQQPLGRIVNDKELEELGTLFEDRYFGELIFLVQEGVLIVPSDMGENPLRGMHGYHPTDPHSYASLCSNQPIPEEIQAIPHMYGLMTGQAEEAKSRNLQGQEVSRER